MIANQKKGESISKIAYETFGRELAIHTTPTLLGIKCGSLISLSTDRFDIHTHIKIFNGKGFRKSLKIRKLYDYRNPALLLIYNEKLMQKRLADDKVRRLLSRFGYSVDFSADKYLKRLGVRLSENKTFPHKIGIFLDYPLEDVTRFMKNKRANYKLCGC